MRRISMCHLSILLACLALATDNTPIASWSFDQGKDTDVIRGFHRFVPGIFGSGLRFDGQTTTVIRSASKAPRLGNAFSIEAWVAIKTYPWTWCAIINQEKDRKTGYFLGIDPEGRFGLHLTVDGKWQESRSDIKLPLYKWNHLVGTFDAATGIRLYWNGKAVGAQPVTGKPVYAQDVDLWVGRNQTPLGLSEEIKLVAPVSYSFDGIIDEVRIHDRVMSTSSSDEA